jgi:hypothetical protein
MIYQIKRGSEIITSVRAEGKVSSKMMGEELVNMSFTLTSKITFQVGDTVEVYGNTYYLISDPSYTKNNSREFAYDLQFAGVKYNLADVQFFQYDSENELTVPEFTVITNAETLVNLLIANANRTQTGWVKGVVDETEHKQVDFSGHNCLSALNVIAEAFDLEFWVDGNKSIHFTKRDESSGYSFKYGKGNGLKNISRSQLQDFSLVTRLYAMGSDKNLPMNYRNGQKKLRMPVPYLEQNTNIYKVIEQTKTFEEIFPKYDGVVTAVNGSNPLVFTDANLPFDLNATDGNGNTTVLIKGVSAKVIFQTGQLAGYTLEIREYGFNSATKTFTLLVNKDEKTLEIPSDLIRPAVGDKYIIVDIMMPPAYVNDAEAKLQIAAQEYLDKNSHIRHQYFVTSDPIYFKANNINITVGFSVHFIDEAFGLDDDIRVTGVTKDLQNKYDVQFEMAEVSSLPGVVKTAIQNSNTLAGLIRNTKFNTELARQSYYFAREMFDKVFDGEGYFDPENIKPLSIETKSISLGSPMQAFAMPYVSFYVENTLTSVSHTSGEVVHFGLIENSTRKWFLTENIITDISEKFNYIYIKCEKQGTVATVVITEDQIMVDSDPDFYFFEAGVLSSVHEGYRQIKMTHGFGMINPAELSIGKISSPFGGSYIDIQQDKIKIHADVEFADDSIAFEQINNQIFIGGENLLIGTIEERDYYDMIEKKDRYINQELPFTVSVDCLSTSVFDALLVVMGKNNNTNLYEVIAQKEFKTKGFLERIWVSFKTLLNRYKNIQIKIVKNPSGEDVQMQKPKLEIGNRPTDYSQSQYDADLKIEEVEKKTNFLTTSIYGNIIATGTVLLGNYETGTNAGITGEGTVNDVFLWGGSTYANRNQAKVRFYRNGKFYASDAHIEGYVKATDGEFTGKITANSGWFGTGDKGFSIYTDGIISKMGYVWLGEQEGFGQENGMAMLLSSGNGQASIDIRNEKSAAFGKTGIYISVDKGNVNTALQIRKGSIRVYSDSDGWKEGFTGTKELFGTSLKFVKGILVE